MGRKPPARTPSEREKQLINLAIDAAERQMRDGTIAPSTLNLYLRMSTSAYEMEQKRLAAETEMIEAKRDNLRSAARYEELMEDAIKALRRYQGDDELYEEELL